MVFLGDTGAVGLLAGVGPLWGSVVSGNTLWKMGLCGEAGLGQGSFMVPWAKTLMQLCSDGPLGSGPALITVPEEHQLYQLH